VATSNSYAVGLERGNHAPVSPLNFLKCVVRIYPKRISVIQGGKQYTRKESDNRCRPLALVLMPSAPIPATKHEKNQRCHRTLKNQGVALDVNSTRLGWREIVGKEEGKLRKICNINDPPQNIQ
jgi:hypothetical protein